MTGCLYFSGRIEDAYNPIQQNELHYYVHKFIVDKEEEADKLRNLSFYTNDYDEVELVPEVHKVVESVLDDKIKIEIVAINYAPFIVGKNMDKSSTFNWDRYSDYDLAMSNMTRSGLFVLEHAFYENISKSELTKIDVKFTGFDKIHISEFKYNCGLKYKTLYRAWSSSFFTCMANKQSKKRGREIAVYNSICVW